MRLKDARETYYYQSGKAGDVGRQLALGGIAVVWLLHGPSTSLAFPKPLLVALAAFLSSLTLDFFQYFVATGIWGIWSRRKEKSLKAQQIDPGGDDKAAEFKAPAYINLWANSIFTLKGLALITGGVQLGLYILANLSAKA
jgi:hypothetical protein